MIRSIQNKGFVDVFFYCLGLVHSEFLPPGKIVNKEYYMNVLKCLRENIRHKRPELWRNKYRFFTMTTNWCLIKGVLKIARSVAICVLLSIKVTLKEKKIISRNK